MSRVNMNYETCCFLSKVRSRSKNLSYQSARSVRLTIDRNGQLPRWRKGKRMILRRLFSFFFRIYQCRDPRSATITSGTKYDEFDKIAEILPRVLREPCKYSFTRKHEIICYACIPRNSQLLPFIFITALPFVSLIGFLDTSSTFSVPWDPSFRIKTNFLTMHSPF